MAKTPRIRHSKTGREPLTIDLEKDEVRRVDEGTTVSNEENVEASAEPVDRPEAATGAEMPATTPESAGKDEAVQANSDAGSAAGGGVGEDGTIKTGKESSIPSAFAGGGAARAHEGPAPIGPAPKAPERRGAGSALAAGLVGGLIVLGGVGGLYYAGVLPDRSQEQPAPDTSGLDGEIAALRAELADMREGMATTPANGGGTQAAIEAGQSRLEAMAVLVEEMRAQIAELQQGGGGPADGGEAASALSERLDTLEGQVGSLAQQEGNGDIEAFRADLDRLQATTDEIVANAQSASQANEDVSAQLSELQQTVDGLSTQVSEQAERPTVALAIAASALKAAIDRGTPFAAELETYAALAPDSEPVAQLRDMAAGGVPTRAAIEAEMNRVAGEMIAAARGPGGEGGMMERLMQSAQSLVSVRPVGQVEGDDAPAIVARMEAAIQDGNYEAALSEYEALPEAARAAGENFAAKVRARQSADTLVGQALAEALRA